MKFLILKAKRGLQRGESHKLRDATVRSLTELSGVPHQAHTYTELRQQIHDDLRIQHPEWIQPNGECPMCDAYEARLVELLDPLARKERNESVSGLDSALEHGLN